jgi:3-oxoacyl-[acyl-carrier protein] reductase
MGNAGQTNYSASKAGIIGFTKALAREVASRSITVNAVAPGFVLTDLTANLPEEMTKKLNENIPLGRWGTIEDVALATAFLASDEAAYITGHVLTVDGGLAM